MWIVSIESHSQNESCVWSLNCFSQLTFSWDMPASSAPLPFFLIFTSSIQCYFWSMVNPSVAGRPLQNLALHMLDGANDRMSTMRNNQHCIQNYCCVCVILWFAVRLLASIDNHYLSNGVNTVTLGHAESWSIMNHQLKH